MKMEIGIPDSHNGVGMKLDWNHGFEIEVRQQSRGSFVIRANEAGLISLARHLLTLSASSVPVGHHIHFDDLNSLEEGSCELIIEKVP